MHFLASVLANMAFMWLLVYQEFYELLTIHICNLTPPTKAQHVYKYYRFVTPMMKDKMRHDEVVVRKSVFQLKRF